MKGVDAWQLPILVTALVLLVETGFNLVLKRLGSPVPSQRIRTVGFGVLVVLTVIVFVAALGPSRADQLSSVAAAVAAVVALWLTYRSYNTITRPNANAEESNTATRPNIKEEQSPGKSAPGPEDPGES
ncbi:hypothetical protein JIG36_46455 [Actinoplanes sp. LDG1-06]|uniref:Uncharacterized protein n=1 Tax=Paractinoplanes ovalisporus TaxID=2810368 RepID=A0ABS2ASW9_9ACTN|nr:hypothetical protein [Actinoplanes ovalisporus]MBM2622967.1 hypothetical protein [Actinoplanes ovalisporus]